MSQKKLTDPEVKRLRAYIKKEGVSQEILAVRWGVSKTTIGRALEQKTGPQRILRMKMVDAGVLKTA